MRTAPTGALSFETALGVTITELVKNGILTLSGAIALWTSRPASILGSDKGTLGIGREADLVVIDPDQEWIVDADAFQSKSRNCPHHGRQLTGKVRLTMVAGRVVARDGMIVS